MNRPKSPVLMKKRVTTKKHPQPFAVTETMPEEGDFNNEENYQEAPPKSSPPKSSPPKSSPPKSSPPKSNSPLTYVPSKTYPPAIQSIIDVCLKEDIKTLLKGRMRGEYLKIFEAYKTNLAPRDYSIIQGGLIFLYTYSRVNSIDETYAKWMIGIFEIPKSHIVAYTSKKILESIAKSVGVSPSGKAEDLVERIRTVIDPSI
jgi:hypothetical protein